MILITRMLAIGISFALVACVVSAPLVFLNAIMVRKVLRSQDDVTLALLAALRGQSAHLGDSTRVLTFQAPPAPAPARTQAPTSPLEDDTDINDSLSRPLGSLWRPARQDSDSK